ncbi:MAG: tail fiber protein [Selenomonas sp.]|nr:tail fiber protein [Selenomonas sp.]
MKGVTPVGGVIIWPKDSDPNTSSIVWLECNGQSYDTNKYKKLYKALGSNKVPNFQGMFLRGSGSQSFTQFNGYKKGNSSTTYSSGLVGEIQGDAIRLLRGFGDRYFLSFDLHSNGMTSYPVSSSWYYRNSGIDGDCWINAGESPWGAHIGNLQNMKFPFNPKHYKYRLEGSGGEYAYYSLSEYTSPPDSDEAISVKASLADIGFSSDIVAPYDNEIRPVNMAVKYYIRAK